MCEGGEEGGSQGGKGQTPGSSEKAESPRGEKTVAWDWPRGTFRIDFRGRLVKSCYWVGCGVRERQKSRMISRLGKQWVTPTLTKRQVSREICLTLGLVLQLKMAMKISA